MLYASAEQRLCLYSAVELQSVLQRKAQQAENHSCTHGDFSGEHKEETRSTNSILVTEKIRA